MGEIISNTAIWIAAIVVGVPVVCVFGVGLVAIVGSFRLKGRQMNVREKQLAVEQQLRMDELNAKILKMDDFGLSPVEIASLAEDVRRLREEVAQLRQEIEIRLAGR